MKMRFLLVAQFLFAGCALDPDTETAELTKYYAQRGDQMTTTLQRAQKVDPKTGKPGRVDPSARPVPTY